MPAGDDGNSPLWIGARGDDAAGGLGGWVGEVQCGQLVGVCDGDDVGDAAAVGLATIMIGAAIVTTRRHEPKHAALNLIYLALILFVAVGRFGAESFN